ncbi:VOC family protein [Nocardiopsis alkaliphila]|uniref:VOC family protein n=1 Tax=Nocardiopsis alkaliphila TaxID=225762 RepID=UPI000376F5F3|nr:VOC family protein [Nocardiopsis alkaliphila]
MPVRWYSNVVDCHDPVAQGLWWSEVLSWRVLYQSDEETVLIPPWMGTDAVSHEEWAHYPPGMVFVRVSEDKQVKNRLHMDLAPHTKDDWDEEVARLLGMGANEVSVGQKDVPWTVLTDPEGNEFCVLRSRDR